MIQLDDPKGLNDYAKYRVAESFLNLPKQIEKSWAEARKIKLPATYRLAKNILVCGMGGSNLASELLRSVYADRLNLPLGLVKGYVLPKSASRNTLVIISSYSGGTEETVACLTQAIKIKAKIICLSTGGQVISLAKKHKLPYYQIDKKLNPSNAPRYALGLQLGGLLGLLSQAKQLKISGSDIDQAVEYLGILNELYRPETIGCDNLAKQVAKGLYGSLPLIVGAEFLSANGHILANQINESAKQLAMSYQLPELNHHLLEGLANPVAVKSKLRFVFFNSTFYQPQIQKRFKITQKVLQKQQISYIEYSIAGDDKLLVALEALLFGSWVSYYLTILNQQNPLTIPWVDYFKSELKK